MQDYPYMISNNKISMIFDKIMTAAIPNKFTNEFLKKMGFASSNDRAFTNLLKKLNFVSSDGTPNPIYSDLKDKNLARKTIANQVKELYSELFNINTSINDATDDEIKGAISRVTGKEEKDVKRIFSTFKALCDYADFSQRVNQKTVEEKVEKNINTDNNSTNDIEDFKANFHYNIQIHLPATTDISVYNAIFKSIRENLFK